MTIKNLAQTKIHYSSENSVSNFKMGSILSSKSKKSKKEPNNAFERGKNNAQKRLEQIQKNMDPKNRRIGGIVATATIVDNEPLEPVLYTPTTPPGTVTALSSGPIAPTAPPDPFPPTAPPNPATSRVCGLSAYDEMALNDMRHQLDYDANAFLLNNILLSVQFFENFEREVQQIKDKPISQRETLLSDAMIHYNKHVFSPDPLLECVSKHVNYQKNRGLLEPLASPKLYVIYDNVEAREPGDTSDYSATFDAPFYKLETEDSKVSGYLKLKRQEVLESNFHKSIPINDIKKASYESICVDSGNEFNNADEKLSTTEAVSVKRKPKIKNDGLEENFKVLKINSSNLDHIQSCSLQTTDFIDQEEAKPKKSILKKPGQFSTSTKFVKAKDRQSCYQNNTIGEESEYSSSGYGSTLSSGSTVTESAMPKRIELLANYASSSGVLPEECWTTIVKPIYHESDDEDDTKPDSISKQVKAENDWSDEDDDEMIESAYKTSSSLALYKQYHYLNSSKFMNNFIVNFKQDLGKGLGFSHDFVRNAMTHGASIYCDSLEDFLKTGYEIIPGLTTTWPNTANQWIIRKRKIIENPRNNYKYQWPVQYMVSRARDFGCVLVPLGCRPKIRPNPDQKLQWKITFPAAERYLESLLAHSHIRCYMFTLALHKTFMESEIVIGAEASHIKNHLFWQCEDNFAKWPEDRLGESLTSFLESFYDQFAKSRLSNYFMESCNDFESIPASVLLSSQRKLKDILETPVMHMLHATDKLKYNSVGFYPTFNALKLYEILTCRNPLYLSNPNLTLANIQEENSGRPRKQIKTNIPLPKRLEPERRHLVLKFFIPHFIAMARSSEKFDAMNQAMIYLEQAQRLCLLLLDEPGGDSSADEYLEVIREKIEEYQRNKTHQRRNILSSRQENTNRSVRGSMKQRPKPQRVISQDSSSDDQGIAPITIADIHVEQRSNSTSENHAPPSTSLAYVRKQGPKESNTKNKTNSPKKEHKKEHTLLNDTIAEETYL